MVGLSRQLSSYTVANCFFMPTGLHPPRMYPVTLLMSATWIIATLLTPAALAAFFKSSSASTGTTNT